MLICNVFDKGMMIDKIMQLRVTIESSNTSTMIVYSGDT